ncbi:MAG TPA: sigma 54-interacting transcriptional regulator, partial [Thermotogota bacterium]|nr:sigma 54-interacting transcriptional regulator [Thermotogota bacterium]HRW94041.1 sigma 54-interacting transcriptional regulator [Thermotogota bacterium]
MTRTFSFEIEKGLLGKSLVIRDLLENLFKTKFQQFGGKETLAKLELLEFDEKNEGREIDFLLGSDQNNVFMRIDKNPGLKFCFFYERGLPVDVSEELGPKIPLPVGLFDLGKFRKGSEEYSELARLEKVVKDHVRRSLSTTTREADLSKSIDWKLVFSSDEKGKKETPPQVSLLSDPSMRELMIFAIRLVEKLKPAGKSLQEIRKKTSSRLKKLQAIEGSDSEEPFKVFSAELPDLSSIARKECEKANLRMIPTVLIEGSTGTGKSLLARFLYERLFKETKGEIPFSKVPLVNLSESILESELFGVMTGTFTGARLRLGKILSNMGGVVFLDEIGDVPLSMQP